MRRRCQRIYQRLKCEFKKKLQVETLKYKNKIINEVKQGKRGSAYSLIRRLGDGPNDDSKYRVFTLPHFVVNSYSDEEYAESLANHFARISQTLPPININDFPPNLINTLKNAPYDKKPVLSDFQVYQKLSKAKKPNSYVIGDIPKPILKEFLPEISSPVKIIFNKITQSSSYPRSWVIEYQTPIPKIPKPETHDDVRNIAKTPFLSKQYESFIFDWLLPFVSPFLDPGQYGGMTGSSITHYLVILLHFIHSNVDKKIRHAVVVAMIDLSKAYNRGSHQQAIQDLYDMHVPGWLLAILVSYLSHRSMTLKYKDAWSSSQPLPGGFPQGCLLGMFLFIIVFTGACLRPLIPRSITSNPSMSVKFMDDCTIGGAINLRNFLQTEVRELPQPLTYQERTGHRIQNEHNILQHELDNFYKFASEHKFIINEKKTEVMTFNFSKKWAFPPNLTLGESDILREVSVSKLLGVKVQSDLTTQYRLYMQESK